MFTLNNFCVKPTFSSCSRFLHKVFLVFQSNKKLFRNPSSLSLLLLCINFKSRLILVTARREKAYFCWLCRVYYWFLTGLLTRACFTVGKMQQLPEEIPARVKPFTRRVLSFSYTSKSSGVN